MALVKLCNEQRSNQMDDGQLKQMQQKIDDLEKKLMEMHKKWHSGSHDRKTCRSRRKHKGPLKRHIKHLQERSIKF
ncbi:hypothetical protein UP17_00115 [Peribacillus simplex]|nr:hypothetical protein UP17_00115 [Peribacillus simplex]